jgi:hypothetical protein
MRILKRQLTIDEIEQEIINIRREGSPKFLEDRKIQELLKSYYYDQRDLKVNSMAKTLVKNLSYILKRRNMTLNDLASEMTRKSGGLEGIYKNRELLTPEYYRTDNILSFAIDFGFALNVSPWDLVFHDVEYLISKNMLSTF